MSGARLVWRAAELFVSSDALWGLLETTGITIFVGPNGSGKSLGAVASRLRVLRGQSWRCLDPDHAHHEVFRGHELACDVCSGQRHRLRVEDASGLCPDGRRLLDAGATGERLVYSTVALLDDDGRDHERFRGLVDYRQLLRVEHADVVFDEVAGVSDASESSAIPVQVVNWMHQLRKRDVRLVVTTPAYSRCSKPIRQVAQVVVDCRSFFPERASSGRLWRPRRGIRMVAYDATAFEDFTAGKKESLDPLARGLIWRPGHEVERRYNTLGQVLMLGHVTESGLCSSCGGSRSRPRCACDHDHAPDVPVEVQEHVTSSGARTRRAVAVLPGGDAA